MVVDLIALHEPAQEPMLSCCCRDGVLCLCEKQWSGQPIGLAKVHAHAIRSPPDLKEQLGFQQCCDCEV